MKDSSEKEKKSIEDLFEKLKEKATIVHPHERVLGVRQSEKTGIPYTPLKSLEEAKMHSDSWIIFQGDWGGVIYATVPVSLIKCTEDDLERLLNIFNKTGDLGEGIAIFYERHTLGDRISGGMGGGLIQEGLWINNFTIEHVRDIQKIANQILFKF